MPHTGQRHDPQPPLNRDGWPQGEWDYEPDRISWKTRHLYPAMIMRIEGVGALAAYVGIPQGHPLYGHGPKGVGLAQHQITYTGPTPQGQQPSRKQHWWIGMHFAHGMQFSPHLARATNGIPARQPDEMETYCNIGYVIHAAEKLARDISEIANRGETH